MIVRPTKRTFWALVLTVLGLVGVWASDHFRRWEIYLYVRGIPTAHDLPRDSTGYEIQRLPYSFAASFARQHVVYLADQDGKVYSSDDRSDPKSRSYLGDSHIIPKTIFVSHRGTIFVSGHGTPTLRSLDGGKTWAKTFDLAVWRMTEDQESHSIYAGIYTPKGRPRAGARVIKSTDEGNSWQIIFEDGRLDHIHTVEWDARYERIYLSAGDGPHRGQAYSDDGGKTWKWINAGGKQGHTTVRISDRYVFWGSDDNLGRVLRAPRTPVSDGAEVLWASNHHIWWLVVRGRQLYAGTLTGQREKHTGAYLLASSDEGESWQKLLEASDPKSPENAFMGDSGRLSTAGWLYCTTSNGKAYRIRRKVEADSPPAPPLASKRGSTANPASTSLSTTGATAALHR